MSTFALATCPNTELSLNSPPMATDNNQNKHSRGGDNIFDNEEEGMGGNKWEYSRKRTNNGNSPAAVPQYFPLENLNIHFDAELKSKASFASIKRNGEVEEKIDVEMQRRFKGGQRGRSNGNGFCQNIVYSNALLVIAVLLLMAILLFLLYDTFWRDQSKMCEQNVLPMSPKM